MKIRIDDLRGAPIAALLKLHLEAMHQHSPPESVHALDLDALRRPGITFWTAWEGSELMGCGALKQLTTTHAELKSMRTVANQGRKGVARALLRHIEVAARDRGIRQISLETGPHAPFAAALKLYQSEGFVVCGPFADYVLDPCSLFMTKHLCAPEVAPLRHNAAFLQDT
jgi:putative acetyltransferase